MQRDGLECSLSLRKQEGRHNFHVIDTFKFNSASKFDPWRLTF
jgi:hypothetical protein